MHMYVPYTHARAHPPSLTHNAHAERGELFVGLQFGLVFLVIIAPLFQVCVCTCMCAHVCVC